MSENMLLYYCNYPTLSNYPIVTVLHLTRPDETNCRTTNHHTNRKRAQRQVGHPTVHLVNCMESSHSEQGVRVIHYDAHLEVQIQKLNELQYLLIRFSY